MNEKLFSELPAWLTKAGLAGTPDTDIFSGFCDRCVAAGMPLGRAHCSSTRCIRCTRAACSAGALAPTKRHARIWPHQRARASTSPIRPILDQQASEIWRRSPFYHMLQTGAALLRRRLTAETKDEFSLLPDWYAAGHDRLSRDHQPLCRRRHHRRDGWRLFVMGDRGARGIRRPRTSPRSSGSCRIWRWRSNRCRSRA